MGPRDGGDMGASRGVVLMRAVLMETLIEEGT